MRTRRAGLSTRARGSIRGITGRYAAELSIALVGALAGIIEATFVKNTDVGLLVVLISFLLAGSVAAIRQDIVSELRASSAEAQLLAAIPDVRWRQEAASELDRQRAEFAAWGAGTRRVERKSSLRYQVDVVRSAQRTVDAVHLAFDDDALDMWANPQRGFDRLVDAYRSLPDSVRCRRILVLDESSELSSGTHGRRMITDEVARRVCLDQTRERRHGGLGFDLRVAWVTTPGRRRIADTLIVDGRETCTIEGSGNGRFGDLAVAVNDAVVQAQVRTFEDLWISSVPIGSCVDPGASSGDSDGSATRPDVEV